MTISIMFSLYHVLTHIVMPFVTFCVHSVCVCVCARIYESGRNYIQAFKKKFLKV